ncbi:Rrf2 family transcriptional regulator [Lacticaseibacillus pabuli]|uniref:Rrf2 family transcriptional regulator n=1 Tax=Lacticaseibacillus pabuli TaxID=3025672 RepID=A0ABY7WRE3_9LACO|nr:Rrf2 family transcriptional regulator [Lacticaseibacillus sp. KACC 23028]WDF82753.1 Rrf2 family transcriptional regulator [Lacticaseibacillus sp. KACC 23028]
MKFTQATNMGLHVMAHLAQPEQLAGNTGIKQLAARFNVSPTYLSKILTRLAKANLVTSVPGAKGGYHIAGQPEQISFADVIRALEGETSYQDGLDVGPGCEIMATMQRAEQQMWQYLATQRITDVTRI